MHLLFGISFTVYSSGSAIEYFTNSSVQDSPPQHARTQSTLAKPLTTRQRLSSHRKRLSPIVAGRSGLAVACLTAVREVPGSNRAAGRCVYRKSHCDLQPWARAVCTLPAVPRSTQPSTLRGMVNEYQLSG